ncbi:MAG: sodium:proton antiporter [Verrucomicrobiota bacterium]
MNQVSSCLVLAEVIPDPHPAMVLPFCAMLLAIALLPVVLKHHWDRHYHHVALGLGSISVAYYLCVLREPLRMLAVAGEYISFMALVASLFVVTSGIHIQVKGGEAKPWMNCTYLLFSALLANVLGTTGASMLMVRPWIRMNKYRYTSLHTVFFIYIVSNVGGCLTPVGDPPLFLGYLKGVPFWWVLQHCWQPWAVTLGLLLVVFYFLDRRNFLRAPLQVRDEQTADPEAWKFSGLSNLGYLAIILGAVLLPSGWREALMGLAALASYRFTPASVHHSNDFTFAPIKEVAWLFIGIFATMVPVLDYLQLHSRSLGIDTELTFFWLTGMLSGVLDNAPTYLTFAAAAFGRFGLQLDHPPQVAQFLAEHGRYMVAISTGAVFFGGLTYIGNGPNLMVKAIAEHSKVHTPNFFSYVLRFSLPILIPIFALVALLFFRH